MNLAMRTSGDPLALAGAVRAEVSRLDPELPVTKLRTMQQILDSSLTPRRLSMWLLTVFALAALLLAALGIYGVMAYAVARRTREIGIRMALGAQRANVLVMILGQGMKLVAFGVAIGLAASLALTRFMTSLLYDVKPTDPLTYAAVALLLISIALAANLAPARRAVSVDPTVSLRHE
jgi:ABC-type antimicrobial peptide transport system permease subunit